MCSYRGAYWARFLVGLLGSAEYTSAGQNREGELVNFCGGSRGVRVRWRGKSLRGKRNVWQALKGFGSGGCLGREIGRGLLGRGSLVLDAAVDEAGQSSGGLLDLRSLLGNGELLHQVVKDLDGLSVLLGRHVD